MKFIQTKKKKQFLAFIPRQYLPLTGIVLAICKCTNISNFLELANILESVSQIG